MKNKSFIVLLIGFAVFLAAWFFYVLRNTDILFVGNYPVEVEIAQTDEQKTMGLMYREVLEDGHGMLFVYDSRMTASIWMKNMLIPLDILFIGEDLLVKHIEKDVPPCQVSEDEICPVYRSEEAAIYVLEIPAGTVDKQGIELGDRVRLPLVLQ